MHSNNIFEGSINHFLNPISGLLADSSVTEIMVVGAKQGSDAEPGVYCEKKGKLHLTDCTFGDEERVMAAIRNIAQFSGRSIEDGVYSVDAHLPSGERVHAIIPPASKCGACLTIRKYSQSSFKLTNLVDTGSLTQSAAEYLELAVLLKKNIVISGGTGSGKTSLLNALSNKLPNDERIIVIEDTSELSLDQPHTVYLEAVRGNRLNEETSEMSIRDLFVESLRMRPDRIIVGEVRRGESLDMVQSMISGHAGALTTLHANSPRDAAIRLETMCLMSDTQIPVYVARWQVAAAIDIVVQVARLRDGSRRVMCISELKELDTDSNQYVWNDIFRFNGNPRETTKDYISGSLEFTGERPSFCEEVYNMGFQHLVNESSAVFGSQR